MKLFSRIFLACMIGLPLFAQAASYSYSTVDLAKCKLSYNYKDEGRAGAICPGENGPAGPIQVEVNYGDWENVNFIYAGKLFLAWKYIVLVGSFTTTVGGNDQQIKWTKDDSGVLRSIAFQIDADRDDQRVSKFLVLGVQESDICYIGTVDTEEEANVLGETGACKALLPSAPATQSLISR